RPGPSGAPPPAGPVVAPAGSAGRCACPRPVRPGPPTSRAPTYPAVEHATDHRPVPPRLQGEALTCTNALGHPAARSRAVGRAHSVAGAGRDLRGAGVAVRRAGGCTGRAPGV